MYLSHTNDYPKYDGEQFLLAVVLEDEIFDNFKRIRDTCKDIDFPYRASYAFQFPTDKARLLEVGFLDEFIKDCKEYESWEMGGDDPLDYYRYQIHPYEPKEDFWHEIKPDSVTLTYTDGSSFGFDAHRKSETYYGYGIDWTRFLDKDK